MDLGGLSGLGGQKARSARLIATWLHPVCDKLPTTCQSLKSTSSSARISGHRRIPGVPAMLQAKPNSMQLSKLNWRSTASKEQLYGPTKQVAWSSVSTALTLWSILRLYGTGA